MTWYWSRCVHDAGVSGTAILPGDNNNTYLIQISNNQASTELIFQVTNSNLGYYWCEINSALRPSIITPVLQPTNTSLPECTNHFVQINHNYRLGPECAAKGSPTIYPRAPLPSFCPSVKAPIYTCIIPILECIMYHQENIQTNAPTQLSMPNRTSTPVLVVTVPCAILFILLIVLVLIAVFFRNKQSNM